MLSAFKLYTMEHAPHKTSAKDFFLYMLMAITLYVSVGTFMNLLFDYINLLFPDAFGQPYPWIFSSTAHSIRLSMATILIVFPIYIVASWFIRKDVIADPEKRQMWVRKWLLYFTLFLATGAIIVDLVTLVFHFFEGELTIRFLLKVLTVLVVAAAVFSYYFWDLKRETLPTSRPNKVLVLVSSVVVGVTIFAGFFTVGSPFTARLMKFDERRVSDLQTIQNQIIYEYWMKKARLPESLDQLSDPISGFRAPVDPRTGGSYEYRVTAERAFELCATFSLKGIPEAFHAEDPMNWKHGKGRTCFSRTIDPSLYPPNPAMYPPNLQYEEPRIKDGL